MAFIKRRGHVPLDLLFTILQVQAMVRSLFPFRCRSFPNC